jgi:Uma2 family endonuclease
MATRNHHQVKSQQIIVSPALVPASRVPRDDESRPAPSGEATLESHPIGRVFYAPFDVVFSRFDVVEPDLLYLSNERAGSVLTPDNVRGTPELVIEIGSPSTRARDETTKRRLYEWAGVSEYWVVDPELDLIRVYRQGGDHFARAVEWSAEAGDMLTTPLFPGLEIPLARVFAA